MAEEKSYTNGVDLVGDVVSGEISIHKALNWIEYVEASGDGRWQLVQQLHAAHVIRQLLVVTRQSETTKNDRRKIFQVEMVCTEIARIFFDQPIQGEVVDRVLNMTD